MKSITNNYQTVTLNLKPWKKKSSIYTFVVDGTKNIDEQIKYEIQRLRKQKLFYRRTVVSYTVSVQYVIHKFKKVIPAV